MFTGLRLQVMNEIKFIIVRKSLEPGSLSCYGNLVWLKLYFHIMLWCFFSVIVVVISDVDVVVVVVISDVDGVVVISDVVVVVVISDVDDVVVVVATIIIYEPC